LETHEMKRKRLKMKRRVDGGKHVSKRVSARHLARPPVIGTALLGFGTRRHIFQTAASPPLLNFTYSDAHPI
jgi:hypothetical protein